MTLHAYLGVLTAPCTSRWAGEEWHVRLPVLWPSDRQVRWLPLLTKK